MKDFDCSGVIPSITYDKAVRVSVRVGWEERWPCYEAGLIVKKLIGLSQFILRLKFSFCFWGGKWLQESSCSALWLYKRVNWGPGMLDDFPRLNNEVLLGLDPDSSQCWSCNHPVTVWPPCPEIHLSGDGMQGFQGWPIGLPHKEASTSSPCFLNSWERKIVSFSQGGRKRVIS